MRADGQGGLVKKWAGIRPYGMTTTDDLLTAEVLACMMETVMRCEDNLHDHEIFHGIYGWDTTLPITLKRFRDCHL